MVQPKREATTKPLADVSSASPEADHCAKLFCATLNGLNKISEEHLRALLNIAITAAEVFCSLSASKPVEGAEGKVGKSVDDLTTFAEQLHSKVEALNQSHLDPAEIKAAVQSAAATSTSFCTAVEAVLIVAMQNSASSQQQTNVLAQAILTAAASRLLSIVPERNTKGQQASK